MKKQIIKTVITIIIVIAAIIGINYLEYKHAKHQRDEWQTTWVKAAKELNRIEKNNTYEK